ncbi:golgin subfamily A member 6-like protein 24 [Macrobrachium nipponense]|uniref:golgin subfamily A member 6-like protein 24 n=1 Tax=Macrobrachium nipponense TaxID=159736 RepID=UPI0030C87B7D
MTLLNLIVYLSSCMALVQLVGSVISTNCYKFGIQFAGLCPLIESGMTGTRTPDDRRGAIKINVMEVEGREEVVDKALNQLKNDLDETSGRNQELLKENMKLLEKEGALRQRIDELQKVLIRQEVDHRHQLAVLREEADRAAEDQAAKMKDLQEEYDNVNGALGWMVIEIDMLKADIARKAVKLATGEKELLALQERANGAEAENSRLREIIADDERRLLQVPQEEDIAALKFDVALKEREIAEVRRALDEESRRNIILQSQIETLKSRVSKQEENGDENAETKQETKEGLKTREERAEDDDVRKAIGVLTEGQAALQRRMNEELEKREKMEQLLESLLNKVEEKPGRTTEAKRQECSEEEEDEDREEVVSESLYAYYSDSAYCLLATEEFARLEEGRTEEEAEDEASMSRRTRKGKKRKRPLACRFRAKRWKLQERSSVLESTAQIGEGKKAQNKKKKNRTTTTKRHLNYYEDMPETQALRKELDRQDQEQLYLKDQLSNRKVRYQRLRDELGAKKLENMVLEDKVAEMKENVRIVNAAAEDLEKQLNRANCIVTQQDEEIDVLKRKLQEMNLINKKKSKICDEKGDEFFQCARQKAKLEEQVEELQRENEKMRREGDSRMCELEQKKRQLHLLEEELKAKDEELKREIEKNPENLGLVDALEGRLQRIIRQKDELAHQEEQLFLMCRHQRMLIERYKHVIDLLLAWREKVRRKLEDFQSRTRQPSLAGEDRHKENEGNRTWKESESRIVWEDLERDEQIKVEGARGKASRGIPEGIQKDTRRHPEGYQKTYRGIPEAYQKIILWE